MDVRVFIVAVFVIAGNRLLVEGKEEERVARGRRVLPAFSRVSADFPLLDINVMRHVYCITPEIFCFTWDKHHI